ncbi:MAG: hypothetical protein HONBIEJF_02872 [Fimbriimonadaceae bacterium]|nr:hypothetical protein [Fimbriimonadaceae bacterium]
MTYTEALPELIEDASREPFKNADRNKDKLDYKAGEFNRTPMEMLVECATVPASLAKTIRDQALPADMEEETHATGGFDSIEACRRHFDSTKGELYEAIRAFPDEKLGEILDTPWGNFPWRDFMPMPIGTRCITSARWPTSK